MRPPRVAEWILLQSHRPDEREAVAGDLEEEFAIVAATHGERAARAWYRRQMRGSLFPNLVRRLCDVPPHRAVVTQQPFSGGCTMRSMVQDVRFSIRLAARRPLVTLVAIASLAVGLSLAAVVFTLLNAVMLRPLPVDDPDRLALLVERRDTGTNYNFSYPDFRDYRRAQQAFTDVVAWSPVSATLHDSSGARPVAGELVSGTFFDVLGVRARIGRTLEQSDDSPGARPAVVVGEPLWRSLGGGDIFEARTIRLNDTTFDIVGVIDSRFSGMQVGRQSRFWVPMAHQPAIEPTAGNASLLDERRSSWLLIMGRLRRGVSMQQAEADLARVEASLAEVQFHRPMKLALQEGARGQSGFPERAGATLRMLLGAALLVLAISAANLANLLTARAADRRREFAVRSALGAGRLSLARLVLIDAVLLGLTAGVCAVLVARWTRGLMLPMIRFFGEPVWLDVSLDPRTLAFTAVATLAAALAGSVVPSVQVLRGGLAGAALQEGGRGTSDGPAGGRLRAALLVSQLAFSVALVTIAALFVRTVGNLLATPTGYDIEHVALLSADPTAADPSPEAIRQYIDRAEARLSAVPGVRAVGFARVSPVGFGGSRMSVAVPGYDPQPNEEMELNYNVVTEGYFAATGIALRAGRGLTRSDTAGRPLVAVVNETMAQRYWDGPALGRSFLIGEQRVEVVGIAPDVKYRMVREATRPSFYLSVQQAAPRAGAFHVRTHDDPDRLLQTLRRALADVDARIAVTDVRTLGQQVVDNINDDRLAMIIGAVLGGSALLLAAAGLFASMWDAVGRRTREIGIRVAMGADGRRIRRLVLGQALILILAGGACGAALAFWLARAIEHRLYEISPADPVSFAMAWAILGGVALGASWAPAHRASRVDPVVALRDA